MKTKRSIFFIKIFSVRVRQNIIAEVITYRKRNNITNRRRIGEGNGKCLNNIKKKIGEDYCSTFIITKKMTLITEFLPFALIILELLFVEGTSCYQYINLKLLADLLKAEFEKYLR